ncbi:MAG: hypothetical protein QXE47_01365 [Candidatus Anstonellales archaeon]
MNVNIINMDIERIVERSDWKRVLVDLVMTNRLDPWDLDLELLAQKIKERIEQVDFKITGDLLLAYAIILKYRALMLNIPEYSNVDIADNMDYTHEIRELKRPARKIPVSLKYLIKIIRKYMKRYSSTRRVNTEIQINTQPIDHIFITDREDFEIKLRRFLDMIADEIMFSDIPGDRVENFLSLLILSNDGKLDFYQSKPFEDIKIVRVRNDG